MDPAATPAATVSGTGRPPARGTADGSTELAPTDWMSTYESAEDTKPSTTSDAAPPSRYMASGMPDPARTGGAKRANRALRPGEVARAGYPVVAGTPNSMVPADDPTTTTVAPVDKSTAAALAIAPRAAPPNTSLSIQPPVAPSKCPTKACAPWLPAMRCTVASVAVPPCTWDTTTSPAEAVPTSTTFPSLPAVTPWHDPDATVDVHSGSPWATVNDTRTAAWGDAAEAHATTEPSSAASASGPPAVAGPDVTCRAHMVVPSTADSAATNASVSEPAGAARLMLSDRRRAPPV